ncbi:MAG: hypothetical protein ACI4J6_00280 [Oscillospiraceae bacterium]
MDLILIIKSNEIRIFKALYQETSPFYIDGEDIYEYESNDFAQDLKDKILTILNEKNFFDIAVHIAYTASEKSAAESILREFVPCRFIQAVVYDNISDPCKTAEQIQTISRNKSAEFEGELAQSNITIKQQTDMITALKSEMEKQSAEYDSLKNEYASLQKSYKSLERKNKSLVKDNQSMQEICENAEKFFAPQRCRCYLSSELNGSILANINFTKKDGEILLFCHGNGINLGNCNIVKKFEDWDTTFRPFQKIRPKLLNNFKENDLLFLFLGNYENDSFAIRCVGSSSGDAKNMKIIIVKTNDISLNETFAVLTHPNDTKEAVLKWLKQASDGRSKELQSQSNNH